MGFGSTTYDPYEGTVIAADGTRVDPDDVDPDAAPPAFPGKPLRIGNIDDAVGNVVEPIDGILTVTRTTTGGNVTPTFDGEAGTAFSAPVGATTAAAFKTALVDSLPNVAAEDFDVAGANGGPWTLEATSDGAWGGQVLPTLSFAGGTGGSVTVEVTEPGRASVDGLDGLTATVGDDHEVLDDVVADVADHEDRIDALEV